jgi:hypothetical protein
MYKAILVAFMVTVIFAIPSASEDSRVFLREDFLTLENWKPLFFSKIKSHTKYSVEKDKDGTFLKAESNASASGIVFNKEFNVYDYPKARWMWKVSNVYKNGDARKKAGDDYPVRIYIIFKYDPETSSLSKRIIYSITKKIYGEYPPHSSLNYIWANREHPSRIITNSYADEAKMVILQTGSGNIGQWLEQQVNILEDYRMVFGSDPPAEASIAIMNDSDNTGEHSVSYVDFIELYR